MYAVEKMVAVSTTIPLLSPEEVDSYNKVPLIWTHFKHLDERKVPDENAEVEVEATQPLEIQSPLVTDPEEPEVLEFG